MPADLPRPSAPRPEEPMPDQPYATAGQPEDPAETAAWEMMKRQPGSISIDDLTLRFSQQDVDAAYERGKAEAAEEIATLASGRDGDKRYFGLCWGARTIYMMRHR